MLPNNSVTATPQVSRSDIAISKAYAPSVGDRFHKPAGTYRNPLTGEIKPTPAHNAEVTMMSDKHVVILIDGVEHTMEIVAFVQLAMKTLANGSTLTRALQT